MKKVMFYTRHKGAGNAADALKNSGTLVLFYTCFICALLIGSTLFVSAGTGSVVDKTAACLLTNQIGHTAVGLICCAGVTVFFGISAGLSCTGIGILMLLPFADGVTVSFLLTYLLMHFGAKGLGYFSLLILPGAILFITATLVMCAMNAETSKKICGILFFEQKESLPVRTLIVKHIIILCSMLLSVLITYLFYKLFNGLFL